MKSKLCSGVIVLSLVVLSATAAYADEPGSYGEEEVLAEPGELDKPADPVTALLQSEVLRYYRGTGAEPSDEELKSGLDSAFDMVLAGVSIGQVTAAVDEAVERHETGVDVPFAVAVPRFIRSLAEQAHAEQSEASERARSLTRDATPGALQPEWRAGADRAIESLGGKGARTPYHLKFKDQEVGTALMVSAFVAQGISFGMTFASIFVSDIMLFSWVIQASTIPFVPMGVAGFALRYGSSDEAERLRWTGIGLLEAAAFAAVVGGLTVAALANPNWGQDLTGIFAVPGMISHFGASIAFGIAGGVCLGIAKAPARLHRLSQSRRSPASPPQRGFVVPTISPRPDGLSLGLAGVF